jgi:hypothetical protein
MADVFTLPKLYECSPNYLYLYQHCVLKACARRSLRTWAACVTAARGQSAKSPSRQVCGRLWSAGMHPSHTTQTPTTSSWSAHSPSTSRVPPVMSPTSIATTRRAEQSKVLQRLAKHGPKLSGSLQKTVSHCARQAARRLPASRCLLTTVSRVVLALLTALVRDCHAHTAH